MSVAAIRRQVKNVACSFSDAQVKVREATSNDPWPAPASLIKEISRLTYNPLSFTEIMSILWKRLNDSGKNWRHVYKSLILLEFLIKHGSEKVIDQCHENMFIIQTLQDFEFVAENKDHGMAVRQKAKFITSLLGDRARLSRERSRCQSKNHGRSCETPSSISDLEASRPSFAEEEELQLEIALQLSKEESTRQVAIQQCENERLKLAVEESLKSSSENSSTVNAACPNKDVDDLLNLYVEENVSCDSLRRKSGSLLPDDPWAFAIPASTPPSYSMCQTNSIYENSVFDKTSCLGGTSDFLSILNINESSVAYSNPLNQFSEAVLQPTPINNGDKGSRTEDVNRAVAENFLGQNARLVNLDNLFGQAPSYSSSSTSTRTSNEAANPFLLGMSAYTNRNRPTTTSTENQASGIPFNSVRSSQDFPFVRNNVPDLI